MSEEGLPNWMLDWPSLARFPDSALRVVAAEIAGELAGATSRRARQRYES
jgi:hypothetical protein